MPTNYRIDKEPRFKMDRVVVGPGVCHVIPPEAKRTLQELGVLEMLEGAYAAGKAERARQAPLVVRMILSTAQVARLPIDPARFEMNNGTSGLSDHGGGVHFTINKTLPGLAQQPFEPFTVPAHAMARLVSICKVLEEQPFTLLWDGEHLTLKDFVI